MATQSQVVNCSLHTGGFDDYHSSLNCQRKDCTEVKSNLHHEGVNSKEKVL